MTLRAVCLAVLVAVISYSCEETPYPVGEPVVRLRADLSHTLLLPAAPVGNPPTGVDSVVVTSMRMLLRSAELHREQAAAQTGYEPLSRQLLALSAPGAPAAGAYTALLATGTYDGMRVELSRLSEAEAAHYAGDARFADFVADGRPSLLLEGTVYRQGQGTPFRYTTDTTGSLSLVFDSPVGIPRGSTTDLLVVLRLPQLLLSGTTILDAADIATHSEITRRLFSSLKAAKSDI